MESAGQASAPGPRPETGQVRAALDSVLASQPFLRAPRCAQLLRFLVEAALAPEPAPLKEAVVGVELFGRSPGYDTQADPIVRVSVRRLRLLLQRYYGGDGNNDPLRIEIPLGAYRPVFQFRDTGGGAGRAAGARRLAEIRLPAGSAEDFPRPSLSPDGQAIAFDWRGPGDATECIYVQSLTADGAARLSRHAGRELRPAWSPNGSQLAHLHDLGDGRFEVHVLPVLGTGDRTVTEIRARPGEAPRLDWAPGGAALVTSSQESPGAPAALVLITQETGERQRITAPPLDWLGDDEAVFCPRGDLLAFRRRSGPDAERICLLPLSGAYEARELEFACREVKGLAWSADGASLIVSCRRGPGPAALWRVPLGAGEPQRLAAARTPALWPAMSRQGRLVFVRALLETGIWQAGLRDEAPARAVVDLPGLNCCPALAPDGSRIAFRGDSSGSDELWVCGRDGGAPFRLTGLGVSLAGRPRWSTDGRLLACAAWRGERSSLFAVPSDGGAVSFFPETEADDMHPSWSRDGRFLYFASNRGGAWQVWKQPTEEGAARVLTTDGGFVAVEAAGGQTVYFVKGPERPGFWEMPAGGGAERRILNLPAEGMCMNWDVEADSIYWLDPGGEAGGRLWRLDPATGEQSELGILPGALGGENAGLSITPGGASALYTHLTRATGQIVLLDDAI